MPYGETFGVVSELVLLDCITMGNLMGHVLLIERSIATLYAGRYEQCRGTSFSAAWIGTMVKKGGKARAPAGTEKWITNQKINK